MHTRKPPRPPQPPPFAAALRINRRVWSLDHPDRYMLIGKAKGCHIRLYGSYISHVHAALEHRSDGARVLINKSELGHTFVDGELVTTPRPLRLGHVIVVGTTQMIATDSSGWFPINSVAGITDLFTKAIDLCGGQRAAERWLGCDHSTIRRRIERSSARRQHRGHDVPTDA